MRYLCSILLLFVCSIITTVGVQAAEGSGAVYLEVLRKPPNRHVIAMNSLKECLRAAEYSNARCISKLPNLADASRGVLRSLNWSAKTFFNDEVPVLGGKDFGPVYLVVRSSPPNRHVIAMDSMKNCLEAAAYTSAECLEKLPRLPDSSIGVFRVLNSSK